MLRILFFLIIVFKALVLCAINDDASVDISVENVICKSELCFEGNLKFIISDGWKIPQIPEINYDKNIANISMQDIVQINNVTYEVPFQANLKDVSANTDVVKINFTVPMCKNICKILQKTIEIKLERKVNTCSLFYILFLACIGGLILNIMPCVLPVVMMKLRIFTMNKKPQKIAVLGTIFGNYIAIMSFAGVIAILKTFGHVVSWGMHFQNSSFLLVIATLVFILVLYSFELIEIFPSINVKEENRGIFINNVISASIAALVAIPCTAPFLGTAAAFAMNSDILIMFLIFFAIATGFTFPFILVLKYPVNLAFATRYSVIAKKIIGFGVAATFLWLTWIMSLHISMMFIFGYFAILVAFYYIYKRVGIRAFILLFFAIAILIFSVNKLHVVKLDNIKHLNKFDKTSWGVFNVQDLTNNLISKRIVFINITADWCMTCKYNKIHVLNTEKFQNAVATHKVMLLEGDLTHSNDELVIFMAKYNRVGIPFNIVFGPNAKSGILISENPSVDEVVAAINKAK